MKDRLKNNLGLKLMAVIFATLLWLFVVNEENPIKTRTFVVPVEVTYGDTITTQGKSYQILEDTKSVVVTVKARRQDAEKIKAEDVKAVATMKERQLDSKTESYEICSLPVSVSVNGYKYEEAYANPRNIQIKIEDNETKTFPITPKAAGVLAQNYSIGELAAVPKSIDVSGPKSSVGRISRVVAKVDVKNLAEDATLPADLIFYDSADNVIDQSLLNHNLIEKGVLVKVHVFEKKKIELKFDTSEIAVEKGYLFAGITFEPQSIEVVGKKQILDSLSTIEVGSEALRLKAVSKKTEVVVDITPYLPEGVRLAEGETSNVVVKVQVEKNGAKTLRMPVASVNVSNLPEDMALTYGPEQEVEIQFEGRKELLEALSIEKITASIDLKDYKEEGTYDVPIQVAGLPDGISMIEGTTIKVVLKKK